MCGQILFTVKSSHTWLWWHWLWPRQRSVTRLTVPQLSIAVVWFSNKSAKACGSSLQAGLFWSASLADVYVHRSGNCLPDNAPHLHSMYYTWNKMTQILCYKCFGDAALGWRGLRLYLCYVQFGSILFLCIHCHDGYNTNMMIGNCSYKCLLNLFVAKASVLISSEMWRVKFCEAIYTLATYLSIGGFCVSTSLKAFWSQAPAVSSRDAACHLSMNARLSTDGRTK